jgi:hypothetical protein
MQSEAYQAYHICVAAHLAPEWGAVSGLVKLAPGYDISGRPITRLRVQLSECRELIHVLTELHSANVVILTVETVRLTTPQYQ